MGGLTDTAWQPTVAAEALEQARRVLELESAAIAQLQDRLDAAFLKSVELICACQGRVVVTGMGKSGLMARKLAATFASLGIPALFLHPADGAHGDVGMITRGDLLVAVSNSGETEEILRLLPVINNRFGLRLIAITGNPRSTLAKRSDVVLDVQVAQEAGPFGLIPTASIAASLAMGDALAIAVMTHRGFKQGDFALFHPGGHLGRRIGLRVGDLMHRDDEIPCVRDDAPVKQVILEMSEKRLGLTCVVDADSRLQGIITDGDLRRAMEQTPDVLRLKACDLMTRHPKTVDSGTTAIEALALLEKFSITSLLIIDVATKPIGVLHIHDLLKAGLM
ncbi:MAG: KpsF/GutQ family sugar-phosphate isomerase [Candidatus Tectomicrobia bacterium]|nr:KpsF/GutQ family sugar-phosphate isomerase [Candidatus Tectomicrobia bacterium]